MSGRNLNVNNNSVNMNKPLKKSQYEQLEQKDYQRIIDQKDQTIRKLQYKVDKLEKEKEEILQANTGQGNTQNFYKQKLQEEIQQNQAAIGLLVNLSHRMEKIIELLKVPVDLSQSSSDVKNMIQMIGGHGQGVQSYQLDQSDPQNFQVIQSEVRKRIEDLQTVCHNYHLSYTKMQKQSSGAQNKLKEIKKTNDDELKALQKQLKQVRKVKQHLQILLEKSQKLKQQVLQSIANSLDPKIRKQIQKMSREDLIGYIKKLTYRITEIQTAKAEVIRENNKIKTADLQKYKKILTQVRQVKEMSRLGQSHM